MLAARAKGGSTRASGEANARTQRKAEIMQEMLDRFEARSSLLAVHEERASAKAVPKRKVAGRHAAAPAASAKAPAQARKPAAGTKRAGPASARAPVPTAAGRKASLSPTTGKTKARQPKATEQPISAVGDLKPAQGRVAPPAHLSGTNPVARSPKAPSPRAPTFGGKARAPGVNAPLDMVAAAQRGNPVKRSPGRVAIQGHVSANVRRSQSKRDSR